VFLPPSGELFPSTTSNYMPRKKAFYAVRSQFNEGAIYETLDQVRTVLSCLSFSLFTLPTVQSTGPPKCERFRARKGPTCSFLQTQDHSKANVKRFSSWIRAESWLGVKVKATFPLTKAQRRRAKTSLRQSVAGASKLPRYQLMLSVEAVTTETSTTIPVSIIGATVPTNSHVPLLRRLPPNASGFPSYAMTAYIGSRYQVTTTGYSVHCHGLSKFTFDALNRLLGTLHEFKSLPKYCLLGGSYLPWSN
jgi:hypothetical protein